MLTIKTEDFLIKEIIPVEKLVTCISPFFDDTYKSVPLIDDQLDTAHSVSRVFIILKRNGLMSFINYRIMEPIINDVCKNEELIQDLEMYKAHFKMYVKRRVCEASVYASGTFQPGEMSNPAEGDGLLIITDETWCEQKPLGSLLELKVCIAEIFKINDFALSLRSIESNCLQMHFYLSNGIGRMVFPLTFEQGNELHMHGIVEVHYREYHHCKS